MKKHCECCRLAEPFNNQPPNPSIERTSNSWLRHLSAAAHVKR